jgi:hypothetical protein
MNSLRIVRYGSVSGGAVRFESQARHWLTQPTSNGASASATATCTNWGQERLGAHRTKNSSASSVTKL